MKSSRQIKADKFIDSCIKKFLFEQDEEEGVPLDDISKFIDSEEKKTKTAIDTDNRIKGAQIDPLERAIKEKQIRINKEKVEHLKKLKDTVNAGIVAQKKAELEAEKTAKATSSASIEVTESDEGYRAPILRRGFAEQALMAKTQQPVKKKVKRVMFEKSTGNPFYVDFSERGFSVGGTRLSFEAIENALSKDYDIVLDGGKGIVLNQVRMQKILRYKE
jgi:DNA-binding transcriptional MerR regulator